MPYTSSSSSSLSESATLWLILCTINNIAVTLLNKVVFATIHFPYPYFLSSVHMLCNFVGSWYTMRVIATTTSTTNTSTITNTTTDTSSSDCSQQSSTLISSLISQPHNKSINDNHHESLLVRLLGRVQKQKLDRKGRNIIIAFSFVFSSNIAIGNVSLRYVSVNFNQVMRSLVPAVTIGMGYCFFGKKTSARKILSVIPVIIGVAMACFGDMTYTALGLFYTILCVILAALKVVASGELMTESATHHSTTASDTTNNKLVLHPIDLLRQITPYAFLQCLAVSIYTGEFYSIMERWNDDLNPRTHPYPTLVVLSTGILSYSMNICSLQANKVTSPLTMCIAGNVKQVLLIALSTIMFHIEITPLNGSGIVVVLIGGALYSYVSLVEKMNSHKHHHRLSTKLREALKREDSTVSTESTSSKSSGVAENDTTDINDRDSEMIDLLESGSAVGNNHPIQRGNAKAHHNNNQQLSIEPNSERMTESSVECLSPSITKRVAIR